MERAKEGSIWRRKIFGEWRRSRMGKEEGGKYAWLEDQGRLNGNPVSRRKVGLY